jgi:hypothetical protein
VVKETERGYADLQSQITADVLQEGFFNVVVDYDRYVRTSDGPVRIRLGTTGAEIEGAVSRKVNNNGTPRILGGPQLRDWFQRNFRPMDTVAVDLMSQEVIILDKK